MTSVSPKNAYRKGLSARESRVLSDLAFRGRTFFTPADLEGYDVDAGRFLRLYTEEGILTGDPFKTIDMRVVGSFVKEATERARSTNPDIWVGAAGDLGGDPLSVEFFHDAGLNGVSASPWLIPVALLAAAQANLKRPRVG